MREFAADAGVNPNTMQRAFAELERLELIRTQRTAGRTVTEDIARIEREKRRLAQAGIDAFWQALAQLGYDRAQALELLRQDLQQAKED
ncbi:MAG: GntR family transcriptional regulator [Oscillospiraceae bacterium]